MPVGPSGRAAAKAMPTIKMGGLPGDGDIGQIDGDVLSIQSTLSRLIGIAASLPMQTTIQKTGFGFITS
ncbi:hypothetical protein JP74_04355 [Devosia sp. 17-2-E-8]|nr:hypothetical protein JP74_04355 [Devosia sp. 17-2-E-8]